MNVLSLSSIHAILLVLKVTIVLGLAGLVTAGLRGRSAAARHVVWLASLLGALALAPLSSLAPRLPVALPEAAERRLPYAATATQAGLSSASWDPASSSKAPGTSSPVSLTATFARRGVPSLGAVLGLVWLAGFAGVVLWSAFGHLGLWNLQRTSIPVERSAWERLCGLPPPATGPARRAHLALSSVVGTPLTWGWRRPVVLLPSRSSSWPLERRRAALLHELAHVDRGDYVAQLVATLACAVYWFHPLAWWATGRLRSESEHACDDRVLRAGTPAPEYATDLLAVAHGARGPGGSRLVAIGMARRSHLEGRLLAVLDNARPRGVVKPRTGLAALAATLLALVPLAGLEPRLRDASAAPMSESRSMSTVTATNTETSTLANAHTNETKSVAWKAKDDDSEASGEHHSMENTMPASPGGRLELDLETGGSVEIRSWDRREVFVHAELAGADWKSTQLAIGPERFGVAVHASPTGDRSHMSTSHRFEIRVPQRYDVRLRSSGGSVTIAGVEGTFEGTTGGGELTLEHARGRASLVTGGGDIQVTDSDLSGSVSTGGGTVKFSSVKGGLKGSSGSGPVIYSDAGTGANDGTEDITDVLVNQHSGRITGTQSAGFLHVQRAGGTVELDEMPKGGEIQTGGGDIRVRKGAGAIDARTGGGDITIGPIAGSIAASTGAGDVSLQLASVGGKRQDIEVFSGTGKVVVDLPADLNARIEIETAYTDSFGHAAKITSAWAIDRKPVTDWDASEGSPRKFVRATGTAGRGEGLIHIQTVNGDIELRRVGATR